MSAYDLIIRNGQVVTGGGVDREDIAVADGAIAELGMNIMGSTESEVDATALHVFPGGIDPHVHFQEPGHTDWEGFATGTQSLAAGGMTLVFDMPLDCVPVTTDGDSFDQKLAAVQVSAYVDFALWGGIVPGNVDRLHELAVRGVVGFKAFMANGTEDFPAVDDLTLYEAMRRCAELGCLVAVHAENEAITSRLTQRALAAGRTGPRDFIASRPVIAENEAIARAIFLAEETGCALHVVHVTTGRGVALVAAAQARGVDVSCETCTHYLLFTEEDIEAIGALGKCAPPLRPAAEQEQLWAYLRDGTLEMVTSDHSASPPGPTAGPNFFALFGGVCGCQVTRQALFEHGYGRRGLSLPALAAVTATNAARRFHIPAKGDIRVGYDADLALVDLNARYALAAADLFSRHRRSPYVGRTIRGRVVRTYVRGTPVYADGAIVSSAIGKLVTPG